MSGIVHRIIFGRKWRSIGLKLEDFAAILELLDTTTYSHVAPYKDKDLLHEKYVREGLSIAQIATHFFSSKEAVRKGLIDAGIKLREPHRPHGRPSQPRYGERIVHGQARPHLAEQRTINAVRDLREQGLTLRQIARFLDQIGAPTKCRGRKWHPEMVSRILQAGSLEHSESPSSASAFGTTAQQSTKLIKSAKIGQRIAHNS